MAASRCRLWQVATIVVSVLALIVTVVGTQPLPFYLAGLPRLISATDQADSRVENIRREDVEQLRAINTRLDAIQTMMLQHYTSPSITSG